MTRVTYTIEGHIVVATTELPGGPLRSHVFICSECGKEWARVVCKPSDGWLAHAKPCRFHKPQGVWDWGSHPGVMTNSLSEDPPIWDQAMALHRLPREVLVWELLREIDFYEAQCAGG